MAIQNQESYKTVQQSLDEFHQCYVCHLDMVQMSATGFLVTNRIIPVSVQWTSLFKPFCGLINNRINCRKCKNHKLCTTFILALS
jgi:hypothetical protein